MKRGFYTTILYLLFSLPSAFATHIVGGGFNMIAEGNYNFRIRLILYFDEINGSSGAIDQTVDFNIFRKNGNVRMRQINVPLQSSNQLIDYVSSACGNSSNVKTRVFYYETLVNLPPSEYSHADGYYVMWERCCRNNNISNIHFPGSTGQTFLMYFPPVSKNNQPFTNDSPVFKPVSNNLFCINQLSTIDFSATDFDGDSLSFDLVDPIESRTADSINPRFADGTPGPYPSVNWLPGYSTATQITGNPKLTMNRSTGVMTLKPNRLGLFVFSVKCEEFRNGIKIGEVRREFQQVVIDCPPNTAPQLFVRDPVKPRNLKQNDTIFITNTTQSKTCVEVKVTDLQVGQRLNLVCVPLNFTPITPLTGDTTKLVTSATDTVRLSFCLPACVGSTKDNPFRLNLIAKDNGCSGSLADTLGIYLVLTVPPILIPSVNLSPPDSVVYMLGLDSLKILVNSIVPPNQQNQLRAEAFDNRNRPVSLNSFGFSFPSSSGTGPLSKKFEWKAPCNALANQPITVYFITQSNFCNQNISIRKPVAISVAPGGLKPFVYVVGTETSLTEVTIQGTANEDKTIFVEGIVNTKSTVTLTATGTGTRLMESYGVSFDEGSGKGKITLPLDWKPRCSQIDLPFPYALNVRATVNSCGNILTDSLLIKLNMNPDLSIILTPDNLFTSNNDGKNDYFSLASIIEGKDCGLHFESLEIYDRWGKKEYVTTDPTFQWAGGKSEYGLFFYAIRFKEAKFNGWLDIVR